MMCQLLFSFADLRFRADCEIQTIEKERKEQQPITSATRKQGFSGSLTGNLDFERRLIMDNFSENSRPCV